LGVSHRGLDICGQLFVNISVYGTSTKWQKGFIACNIPILKGAEMNADIWLVISYIILGLLGLASLWVLFRSRTNSWRLVSIGGLILTFLGFNERVFHITDLTVIMILMLLSYFLLAIGMFMSGTKH
jgi:hypothetical protein